MTIRSLLNRPVSHILKQCLDFMLSNLSHILVKAIYSVAGNRYGILGTITI